MRCAICSPSVAVSFGFWSVLLRLSVCCKIHLATTSPNKKENWVVGACTPIMRARHSEPTLKSLAWSQNSYGLSTVARNVHRVGHRVLKPRLPGARFSCNASNAASCFSEYFTYQNKCLTYPLKA